MNLIQDIYIRIFNGIFNHTERINPKIREAINIGCILLLTVVVSFTEIVNSQGIISLSTKNMFVFGNVMILLICVFSVNGKLERINWDKWIVVPYFIAAGYMALMSIDHYTGAEYSIYPFALLIVFPALYIVWGNSDNREKYIKIIAVTILITGLCIVLASILYAPVDGNTFQLGRYAGLCKNTNSQAIILLGATAAGLYLTARFTKLSIASSLVVGMCTMMIIFTESRTAILALAAQFLFWIVMTIKCHWSKYGIKSIAIVVIFAIVMSISYYGAGILLQSGVLTLGDYGKNPKVMMTLEGGANNSPDESAVAGAEQAAERFDGKGMTLDTFSSGRITLWKWHLQRMHVRGNECINHKIYLGREKPWKQAHNLLLDIGYRYGFPAMLVFLFFMIMAGIKAVRNVIRGRYDSIKIFTCLLLVGFFFESMLDLVYFPFQQSVALGSYILLGQLFSKDECYILEEEEN